MVTVQDIGLQLTKPVKELAEWNYPFSQVCIPSVGMCVRICLFLQFLEIIHHTYDISISSVC